MEVDIVLNVLAEEVERVPDRGDNYHIDLIAAVHANDTARASHILQQECQQNTLDSCLCWASRYGNVDMVGLLLRNGANPNAEVWGGFTPLIWTSMYAETPDVLLTLLAAGANINHQSAKRRQTSLHAAVIRDNVQFVSVLLEGEADPDVRDYLHKTPLFHAVQRCSTSCVKLLVHYNCDVTLRGWVDGVTMSPLLQALCNDDLEVTHTLILAGARFDRPAIFQDYTVAQYYATLERELDLEVRPVYLQQHCRVCIRHLLKPSFLRKLRQMNLPPLLEKYLLIEEIDV